MLSALGVVVVKQTIAEDTCGMAKKGKRRFCRLCLEAATMGLLGHRRGSRHSTLDRAGEP